MRLAFAAAGLALAASCGGALAQNAAADPSLMVTGADRAAGSEAVTTDRVVTRGARLDGLSFEEYVSDFVGEISRPVSGDFGIARWADRICVGAMNIEADAAQFIVNRVSDVAAEVGLKPGEAGCAPQIFFIFTEDGPGAATALAEAQPLLFRPYGGLGGTTQSLHELENFKTSEIPVRWWQTTMSVDWQGRAAVTLPSNTTGPNTFTFVAGSNSRITSATKDELWRTIVIVDVSRLDGANWAQLADYLAVVSLAQIDPGAQTAGYDTILNLFDGAGAPSRMTDWDLSFLRALYSFDQTRRPDFQPGLLAHEMTRDQLGGQ